MENLPFWLLTVAYSAHIMEEYTLDWRGWAQQMSNMQLSWTEFFTANFAVIILGISCSVVGFECPIFSFLFVGLATVNALFAHIGTTIVKRKFSPGILTSLLLFLPICTWTYIIAAQKGILTIPLLCIT
ncbi:MAG: HXXEE domain-containing protein [Prevotella sp.]|jgi:hypothetical protein|nr:HXXEE domain-containing protein [Prevotella sp.]